jgi:hypothetical protein
MRIGFTNFVGANSDISPELLPENYAVEATNCFTDAGALNTWKSLKTVPGAWNTKTGILKTIFLLKNTRWLAFGEPNVDVALMQLESNVDWNSVYSDGVKPKYTNFNLAAAGGTGYPATSYALGIPKPAIAFVATVSAKASPANSLRVKWQIAGTVGDAIGNRIARSYVYTYVNDQGREGPPSNPSNIVFSNDDEFITLTANLTVPAADINKVRVYVAATGGTFNFLLENNIPDTSIDVTSNVFGAPIETTLFSAPPDGMLGVVAMANGILAGYLDNNLYFSQPYQSHAWPEDYIKPMDYPIKGLAAIGNMLFISTEGYPVIAIGNDPAFMTFNKLGAIQANVSDRSMVDMGIGAMYASKDGIVLLSGGEAVMISDGILSERVYQLMVPSSIHAYFYRDKYIGFYASGQSGTITAETGEKIPGSGAFILDPKRRTVTFTDVTCDTAFSDKVTGKLFLARNETAGFTGVSTLYEWNEGTTNLTQAWTSKPVQTAPMAFSVARIWSKRYPITFQLIVDGVSRMTQAINNTAVFRLPSGFLGREWQIRVSGDAYVNGVFLATDPEELK